MNGAFSNPHNRNITLILLGTCAVLAIAAVIMGIDDNLPGVLSAFLAATAFILAFVHPWRSERKFLFLVLAAVLGFVLFTILSIVIDTTAQNPTAPEALRNLTGNPVMEALSLIFAMTIQAAFTVGGVGWAVLFIRRRRQRA